MRIIGPTTRKVRVKAVSPSKRAPSSLISNASSMFLERFYQFWDLMDTIRIHGYIRTAMSVIGRSSIGAGWDITEHKEWGKYATNRKRNKLLRFYTSPHKTYTNIQDYFTSAQKIMIGVMYLRYFGRAAYKILRDNEGNAVGWDFLYGFVVPHVDSDGKFKDEAAFVQFLSNDLQDVIYHKNPKDIIYIVNPDWEGFPGGGTDMESLATFTLPLDIYLQTTARQYVKNNDKPEVIYSVPADASQEAFDAFVEQVQNNWAGPTNSGRSPIIVAGEVDIKELSKMPSGLPYGEARAGTISETQAVTGVNSGKMGDPGPGQALRELRREFHETTMVPLFTMLELAFYEQVHVREFQAEGWVLIFKAPDFLTAVERATVDMRYTDIGVFSPNEIRREQGMKPRTDPLGDAYADHTNPNGRKQPQGSPPEGREEEPDSPSNIGEPTLDDQDPPRGDQHDEEVRSIIAEARTWKKYAGKRAGKESRPFDPVFIPTEFALLIQEQIDGAEAKEETDAVFDDFIDMMREETKVL